MTTKTTNGQFKRLLVVDDTPANLQLLMNLLTEQGYIVHPASDGELALEFIQLVIPDLILLDVRMPGMDGYEVCRRLKADEKTRAIPIIFISILEDERDKVKAFQEGAVDYITKPFHPEEVLARVRTHLRLRELTERLEKQVSIRTEELTAANERLQREIEEHRRAEEAVRQSQRLLQSIMDNSSAVIYVKDLEGKYLMVNHRFEELFHVTQESVAGRTDYDLFPKDRAEAFRAFDERVAASDMPLEAEEEVPHDDGVHTYISIKAPICDEEGRPYAVCGISTDITERKQVDRMKDDFISTAAHELRTPLTTVLGYLQLLMESGETLAPQERREFLETVYRNSEALARIVEDLHDLSTVQAGRLITLQRSCQDLAAIIGRTVAAWQGLSDRHRFILDFPEAPVDLCIDPDKVRLVLENLLSNGVKFSPAGGPIRVRGERAGEEFRVTVEDEGVGMRPEEVARVFDKFYRADASDTALGGLGLGMSIVRSIVEAHGGRIWVESEPGRGTKVHFALPLH